MIEIREASPSDLPSITGIYHEAVHRSTTELYDADQRRAWAPEPLRQDEEHWRARLGGREVLIASRGGAPVGFCAFVPTGHIDLLYTHPDHGRRGVASALVAEVETRLRRAGALQVHAGASRLSRALFERLGYRVVGEEVAEVRGVRLPHTRMQKFL